MAVSDIGTQSHASITQEQFPYKQETAKPVIPISKTQSDLVSYGITLEGLKHLKSSARSKLNDDANRNAPIDITDENLSSSWKEVVERIASEKMLYKSAIQESKLTFIGHEITIHANVVAFDFLKSERIGLLDFFKAHYHNEQINVLFKAKMSDLEQKGEHVMSTREIFDMMADKNPNLRVLKDKFGMDIEY